MAEIVKDENGNIITDLKLITMLDNVEITGSGGTRLWFYHHKQYQFSSILYKIVVNDCLGKDAGMMKMHFRVVRDGENYDIPDCIAIWDDKPRYKREQDQRYHREYVGDQPKDVIDEYFKITGIDLSGQNLGRISSIAYDNYLEWLRIRKENQGKSYGQVERRTED